MLIGGLVALIGVAVVGAVGFQMRKSQTASVAVSESAPASAGVGSESTETVAVEEPSEESPAPSGTSLANLPDADGEAEEADAATAGAAVVGGPLPTEPAADDVEEKVENDAKPKPDLPKDGDLSEAVADAVGADLDEKAKAEKEATSNKSGPTVTPTRPPQGAVSAGVRPGRNAAKNCVAGADDVTSVNLTFASSGNVTSVSVGGWAAANGKSACVKSAFAGVNVGKFQDSSYSVGVSVRP